MQEGKEAVFDAADAVKTCLSVCQYNFFAHFSLQGTIKKALRVLVPTAPLLFIVRSIVWDDVFVKTGFRGFLKPVAEKAVQQNQPGFTAFFDMELRRKNIIPANRRRERAVVVRRSPQV